AQAPRGRGAPLPRAAGRHLLRRPRQELRGPRCTAAARGLGQRLPPAEGGVLRLERTFRPASTTVIPELRACPRARPTLSCRNFASAKSPAPRRAEASPDRLWPCV